MRVVTQWEKCQSETQVRFPVPPSSQFRLLGIGSEICRLTVNSSVHPVEIASTLEPYGKCANSIRTDFPETNGVTSEDLKSYRWSL